MFSKCANPDCEVGFDYHQGQFFRFHKIQQEGAPGANTHAVQHFWLCGNCHLRYSLVYQEPTGVLIRTGSGELGDCQWERVIAAA
jgi:hypothetical protein